VIYVERAPTAPLNECVRMLWYTQAPQVAHSRERVLPSGCVQVILNLARDFLLACAEDGRCISLKPSLVVGARPAYEIVDSSDMAELIGVVFHPGGFAPFCSDPVDVFSSRSISLEDVWGRCARSLRDQLRETPGVHAKLDILETFLLSNFAARLCRNQMADFAIRRFAQRLTMPPVKEVARETGWSERHFSQVFREQVGLAPKTWCRIQRFQRAVRQLHAGADISWASLALNCGYYDQSHFANEFRAFSGIDMTSYSAARTRWANHVPIS
jgi:AraC-like DNA-binding protein